MAGLRILIVDDDHDSADSLTMLLRLGRHEARACYTGEQCLACLDEFRPHAVLLDLGMPGMDGYDVAAQLRDRDIVLIAVTGYSQAADVQRTREAGFAAHLLKPVTLERLQHAVAVHVAAK
jgi:CheY-like chemotaxis protein